MQVFFNSRDKRYKTPFGAVKTGEQIMLVFPVSASLNIKGINLVYRLENESNTLKLEKMDVTENAENVQFDFYRVEFSLKIPGIYRYRFEIVLEDRMLFVGRGYGGRAQIGDWLDEWQLTVYSRSFDTPEYLKGAIVYHIFVDRFNRAGDTPFKPNAVIKSWGEDVNITSHGGVYQADDFYGGNLKGIEEKLPYLKSLGVKLIYLSPIFESISNHRYDTGNYLKIDETAGSEEDFKNLIESAKAMDMYIMLDGVFNHTGYDSIYFNRFGHYDSLGAYQSKDSPYYNWYTFKKFPDDYRSWWGIKNVPTVREDAEGFHNLVLKEGGVLEKWTKLGVSGWRLDVVDELSSRFVEDIRNKIKTENKNALLIGEVWEDASTKVSYGTLRPYLLGQELDGVMNYPFKSAILDFIVKGEADRFTDRIMTILENYPKCVIETTLNMLGSHDTVRALNVLSGIILSDTTKGHRKSYRLTSEEYELAKKRLKLAVALQFMLDGMPTVYYGDEAGMQGFEDPINRRPFPKSGDNEITDFYKVMAKLRLVHHKALTGETEFVRHISSDVIMMKRVKGLDSLIVVVNRGEKRQYLGFTEKDILSKESNDYIEPLSVKIFCDC